MMIGRSLIMMEDDVHVQRLAWCQALPHLPCKADLPLYARSVTSGGGV
jgi:hypothetical protein